MSKNQQKQIKPRLIMTCSIGAILVILNSLILCRLGVDLLLQILVLLAATGFVLCGMILLGKKLSLISDSIIGFTVSFLLGVVIFTGFNFILLHFDNRSLWIPANCAFFSVILIAGLIFRKRLTFFPHSVSLSKNNIILGILLSLLLSITTGYGFLNTPTERGSRNRIVSWSFFYKTDENIPNWGWNKDKRYWLGSFTANIEDTGLPEKSLLHNGVQVFYLSLTRLLSPEPLPVTKVYKAILALFYFCLIYSFTFIGEHFFGLKNKSAALLAISVPFFATINYPFFTMGRSSYLGFFPAGVSFFHSITQFMSLPVGVAGIILSLPDSKKKGLSAWGALLVAAAFFFKPSFFAIAALPLAVIIWLNRNEELKQKIISSLILIIPPLFWKLYPAIYGIEKLEVPLAFQPFQVLFHYSFRHFPSSIYANDYIFGGLIVILSFGVFIPIGLDFIIGMLEGRNSKRWEFFSELREKPAYLFSTGAFLIGILSYGLLVQDSPQKFHANLSWGAAIGYLLFLPVLIKMITAMKYLGWKIAAGILFALHLWGGIYHLYRFTFLGMIY